jgi:8-amino-3,8-dideoxy-alpha-D-manno-octulosonate transaminase
MKAQNVWGGNFYWYDHNWHYIRKWEHFKKGITLNALHPGLKAAAMQQANKDFSASDAIMSRGISTQIPLSLSEQQMKEKGEKIVSVIKKVLAAQKISA